MSVGYQIWVRDTAGDRIGILDAIPQYEYSIVANGVGNFTLHVPYNHGKRHLIQPGYRIEIERNRGSGWPSTPVLGGTIRYIQPELKVVDGFLEYVWVAKGVSYEDFLVGRLALPDAMIAGHYGFPFLGLDESLAYEEHYGATETVMKDFVRRNLVEWDIDDDDRSIPLFTVEPDGQRGRWLGYRDRFAPILEVLQALAAASGIDFYVSGVGNNYEFCVRESPDRRLQVQDSEYDPVVFKAEWGRIASLEYTHDGLEVSNFIYVGGKVPTDEETEQVSLVNQPVMVADGTVDRQTGKQISIYPRRESYVDARGSEDPYDLLTRGAEALEDRRETTTWKFEIHDQPGLRWQENWNVGDLVSLVYEGTMHDCKLNRVSVVVDGEGEHVTIDDVSIYRGLIDLQPREAEDD